MKELIIDCFAGGGGASVGIEMALGRPVDIAINHDPDAILMHKTNHPTTLHLIAKQSAQCKAVEILCGPVHDGQTQSIALLLAEGIEKMWYTDMPEE